MLRFGVQIKVLWPGTQKYKGWDSLVLFTCEKSAYHVVLILACLPAYSDFASGLKVL